MPRFGDRTNLNEEYQSQSRNLKFSEQNFIKQRATERLGPAWRPVVRRNYQNSVDASDRYESYAGEEEDYKNEEFGCEDEGDEWEGDLAEEDPGENNAATEIDSASAVRSARDQRGERC